jgi:hypothetical protein
MLMQKGSSGRGARDDGNVARCQRCLQDGHWTFECTNLPAYKARPSRTQELMQPHSRFLDAAEIPPEFRGPSPSLPAGKTSKGQHHGGKRRRPSSSTSTSDSGSSSSGTSTATSSATSSLSSQSDSSSSGTSATSSSYSDSSSGSASRSSNSNSSSSDCSDSSGSSGSRGHLRLKKRDQASQQHGGHAVKGSFEEDLAAREYFAAGKASGKAKKARRKG